MTKLQNDGIKQEQDNVFDTVRCQLIIVIFLTTFFRFFAVKSVDKFVRNFSISELALKLNQHAPVLIFSSDSSETFET